MEKIHYTHDAGSYRECPYHPKAEAKCLWVNVDWKLYELERCERGSDSRVGAPRTAEETFKELAAKWQAETAHLSAIDDIVLHPAYQDIIGLGPSVIPLLLTQLQATPNHWFWALEHITRQNPVRPEDIGIIRKMADSWLEWGRQQGYL